MHTVRLDLLDSFTNDLIQEAVAYEAKAVQAVQEQTMQYLGDAVATIRMVGVGLNGGGFSQWF